MTDSPSDDARLGATEAQMRRVLGLHGDTPRQSATDHPTTMTHGSHPQKRRFVRDGEVPVTVIHRDHRQDDTSGANQLDAARQAIRSQAAAREHAERLLAEAQTTIRALQTKLGHERLAKEEVILRAEVATQLLKTVRAELVVDRAVRDRLERSVSHAEATIADLRGKLDGARAELATERRVRQNADVVGKMPVEAHEVAAPANRSEAVPTVRRPVGRPRKTTAAQPVEKPVKPSAKARAPVVPKNAKGLAKPGRPAQRPAGKPVKWWLTGR